MTAANKASARARAKAVLYLISVNAAVFLALFVLFEIVAHIVWPEQNPFLGSLFSKLRIPHPVYGHTLVPNFDGEELWGSAKTHIITNSLGFKDASTRQVPLQSPQRRILFLGDSFTEAEGIPYEQSFVGRFAAAFPQLDVLNGAVSSYSPSIYYAKTKYLLGLGLQVDEIIVYIDISDIQDEAIFYRFGNDDRLQEGNFDAKCPAPEMIFRPPPWWLRWSYVLDFFYKRHVLSSILSSKAAKNPADVDLSVLMRAGGPYARGRARASWTYDPKPACYGTLGVEGAVTKAKAQMDRLYALASQHNITLSVGVYPWPQQLLYDKEESRQVTLWRTWCETKCRRFFNHFPAFFAYKREHPDFMQKIFIWGDVHYNPLGNEIVARDLIAQYP